MAEEKVRAVYATDDPDIAGAALDDAIAGALHPEVGPELAGLAKTLRRWRAAILARYTTGASNGPAEAANLLIQARQTVRTRLPQRRQLLPPHPPRRRHEPHPQDSTRHEHPTPTSQVGRVGSPNSRRYFNERPQRTRRGSISPNDECLRIL